MDSCICPFAVHLNLSHLLIDYIPIQNKTFFFKVTEHEKKRKKIKVIQRQEDILNIGQGE